jgi:hypothetical protein
MIAAQPKDLDDVWVIDRGGDARFMLKLPGVINLVGKFFPQEFDRNEAIEPGIAGFVNRAHASTAQRLNDYVMFEDALDAHRRSALGTDDVRQWLLPVCIDARSTIRAKLSLPTLFCRSHSYDSNIGRVRGNRGPTES